MVTGPAGTGKSFLLRYLRSQYPQMPVTASTGIAALGVGGCTLHSWAGMPTDDTTAEEIAARLNKKKNNVWHGIKTCKQLAIDEVSMISAQLFDRVNRILQLVRENTKPFGGVQLILFGDFLQLPPVPDDGQAMRFAFESLSWERAEIAVYLLTEPMRQKDRGFSDVLARVRIGDTSEEVRSILRRRINALDMDPDTIPVELATHNEIADRINRDRLAAVKGEEVVWDATDWADGDFLMKKLDKDCIALKTLTLKVGCQVMLLKNLSTHEGLANGSLGTLVDVTKSAFGGRNAVVKFSNGITREIERAEWEIKRNQEVLASRRQMPLRPAYALSIHKSQGLTLEKVRVHLKRVFADGMAYVSMSRAKTIEGLFIADITGTSIRANPTALEFYRRTAL